MDPSAVRPHPPFVVLRCSPDRIRTGATALRGRRARPLHNGASTRCAMHHERSEPEPRARAIAICNRAGVPGLEPRLTEPESVGLPITPYPIGSSAASAPTANAPQSRGMAATSRRRGYPTRGRVNAIPIRPSMRPRGARLDAANAAVPGRPARSGAGPAVRSRPSSSSDSNSGGETRRPVTATRTGPKASLGLSPRPSTSAARNAASISAVLHSETPDSASLAAASSTGRESAVSSRAAASGSTVKCASSTKQEAEHVGSLGETGDPLLDQGRDPVRSSDAPRPSAVVPPDPHAGGTA